MARFDAAIALAQRLIDKNGESSKLRRRVDSAPPDVDVPFERDAPTTSDTDVRAAWLGYKDSRVDGTLVRRGDQRVLVAAADLGGVVPNEVTDSMVRASGEVWGVVEVRPLNPNGQAIMYTIQVRK